MQEKYNAYVKKIGIHPLFLLLGLTLGLLGQFFTFFIYLLVAILHEGAHALVAHKLGYKLDKIFLMPYGAGLSFKQNFINEKDEIIISSAGPILNFSLCIIFISLWWIIPTTFTYTQEFVMANFVLGITNLLPCFPLDGGRIIVSILNTKIKNRQKILKILFIFNYFFSFLFIFIFFLNIFNYFQFLIFAIFIFFGTFDSKLSGNYTLKNFPFFENNINNKETIDINHFAVSEDTKLYKLARYLKKNKLNLVYVILKNNKIKIINEQNLINYFKIYPSYYTISEIINKK